MTQPRTSDTFTIATDLLLILCRCCKEHRDIQILSARPVQCKTCGEWCTCSGCIAEGDDDR